MKLFRKLWSYLNTFVITTLFAFLTKLLFETQGSQIFKNELWWILLVFVIIRTLITFNYMSK